MRTFENVPITKAEFVKEMKKHQAADAFIRGTYSNLADPDAEGFKGCAVGCAVRTFNDKWGKEEFEHCEHSAFEEMLGVPTWLARLQDRIFEGLPAKRYKTFPVEFAEAIPVGVDLDQIKPKVMIFILKEALKNAGDNKSVIQRVIDLWKRKDLYSEEWEVEATVAGRAASYAASTAAYAASDEAYATSTAVYAAASTAATAARAADSDAASAAAWGAVCCATSHTVYTRFANKLLKLMRECK